MNQIIKPHHVPALQALLAEAQAATRQDHAEAIRLAREAFEARLTQAVAYRVTQVLDAITGE